MKVQPNSGGRPHGWLIDNDFGWRGRLGVITPSRGWTLEHEWPRMLPQGISYHVARMLPLATTPEEIAKMSEYALEAAESLASANVDIICYGCTIETMPKGIEYDRTLTENLAKATGIPAKTMAGAVVEALNEFGTLKIAVVTPYIDKINIFEKTFLEDNGFEVIHEKGRKRQVLVAIVVEMVIGDIGVQRLTEYAKLNH